MTPMSPTALLRRHLRGIVGAALLTLMTLGLGACGGESEDPASEGDPRTDRPARHDDNTTMPDSGKDEPFGGKLDRYHDAPATTIRLTDVTARAGITAVNHSGRKGVKEFLLEAVGTGPAWFDYDGDGLLDVYIPDGDVFSNYTLEHVSEPGRDGLRPWLKPKAEKPERFHDRLYRNQGDGTFEDVTAKAGLVEDEWGFGATAFDLEGDGDMDLYVSNFGRNRLWRNNGDGSFTDVAEGLGVQGDPYGWSTCAAIADLDGDGLLDIYVSQYSDPAAEVEKQRVANQLDEDIPVEAVTGRACTWRGLRAYCGPRGLEGQQDICFRQRADGTFEDVTEAWRLVARVPKYCFTTLIYDANGDGLLDIYVANDSEENFLWQQGRRSDGSVVFREIADIVGIKYGHNRDPQASMGAACADINQDGLLDVFITNFSHDYNNIYLGHTSASGMNFYKDRGLQVMGQAVFYDLSWGCGWIDFDNDFDLDLYFANGHVYKEIDLFAKTGVRYAQYNSLFECMDAHRQGYREIGTKAQENAPDDVDTQRLFAGDGMAVKACSRGVAFVDWNNDGRMEMLVQNMNEPCTLLLNTSETSNGWVKFVLQQPGGNREALGATVVATVGDPENGGLRQAIPIIRHSSFLGSNDPRMHLGLGTHGSCTLEVHWPGTDGAKTTYADLTPGRLYVLDRATGKAIPQDLKAFEGK